MEIVMDIDWNQIRDIMSLEDPKPKQKTYVDTYNIPATVGGVPNQFSVSSLTFNSQFDKILYKIELDVIPVNALGNPITQAPLTDYIQWEGHKGFAVTPPVGEKPVGSSPFLPSLGTLFVNTSGSYLLKWRTAVDAAGNLLGNGEINTFICNEQFRMSERITHHFLHFHTATLVVVYVKYYVVEGRFKEGF